METVPLKKYCEISGESLDAVKARIDRGYWAEGTHFHKIRNVRERWIDMKAVEKWVRNGGCSRAA